MKDVKRPGDKVLPPLGASGLPDLSEAEAPQPTETNFRPARALGGERLRPTLSVLTGFEAGTMIPLVESLLIGRTTECDLVLSDPGVSREHARIVRRGDDVLVYDLKTKNGTYVGDEVVLGGAGRALLPRDVIHLGPHVSARFEWMTEEEEEAARELYESLLRDPVTRAYNRRYLAGRLKAEVAFAARHEDQFSVISLDIDRFRSVDERHGHASANTVLRRIAAVLSATLRVEDVLARLGGDEFVVVLRGIDAWPAMACAERLRLAVERADIVADGMSVHATVSAGVASSNEVERDGTGAKLLELANGRRGEAKAAGRNRIVGPSAEPAEL